MIPSKLYTKASKELQKEIEEELSEETPILEKATAALKNNEVRGQRKDMIICDDVSEGEDPENS